MTDCDRQQSEPQDDDQSQQLKTLFETVTGVQEVVDKQEPAPSSRYIDGDSPSAAVTQFAKEDGLDDAIDSADGSTPD